MLKLICTHLKALGVFVFIASKLGIGSFAHAQETTPLINATFGGVVRDAENGEPLAGATLQLAGITHSTKTDRGGHFQFVTGQKLPATLIVSYIGYETKQVVVTESPVTIELERSASSLGEVVVTS